jgi:lysozyme family protein
MEGGWSDDPYDPGGPTNYGVTLATFAAHRGVALDAANIAAVKAALRVIAPDEVRTIYRDRYWVTSRCVALPPALAVMHFDAAVNHGVGGAARLLQQALGVAIDGEIGDETLAAARALDPLAVADRYADLRRARYRSLGHFWRFGRGWLARVDKTQVAARAAHRSNSRFSKEPQMSPVQPLPSTLPAPKWWGHSLTIWGAIVTTLATVLPALGPVIGIDISGEMVRELGDQLARAVQAVGGLVGIAMTVYGRFRATRPLERRDVQMRV